MRKYQLYLIEDEFASHYFGRERMFFQLFQENEQSSGDLKYIVNKQVQYVTKPIPALRIHQVVHQQLGKLKGFRIEEGTYYLEMNGMIGHAKMRVDEGMIILEAEGSFEAETAFFEVLRKCEPSFLAVDLDHNKFGWLKPIKERKFV
ncbi:MULTISPECIES: sporulation inhibitor of replication protein SirA [unclassified Bacillus (in: firmicutes)]|uniref:sporulation inhibitor of replication protein SirA n=1 Tax=unclassified Bacillus (in: firmicutes) TaxID=185979 RepID=UPI000B855FB3|nr:MULTISPECIES: sporulation inhibitor of replication protein SirA [unclassified Bacillus (in: firmicutes)]